MDEAYWRIEGTVSRLNLSEQELIQWTELDEYNTIKDKEEER